VDPKTLEAEVIINNFYQQPFLGFNDIDIDPNGNIWVTDSTSAWVRTYPVPLPSRIPC
jgi:sugar lactone lactonase YvrE